MTNYDILKEYEAHQTPVPSYKEWEQLRKLLKEIKGKLHYINTPKNQHNIFDNDFIKRLDNLLNMENKE